MVFVKKASGSSRKPREVLIGRLVGISSDEAGTVSAEKGTFNYIDLLFIEVDKDLKNKYNGKKEDGTPKPVWNSVRTYPSLYNKATKESEVKPLSDFKELEAVDALISTEKAKPAGEERKFPIITMEVYKTLNEGKDGTIYKNFKASGIDLRTIKLFVK